MDVNVKYALFIRHDSDWYEVKAKNEYAFWLIQSGSLVIEYNHKKYTLSEGDIFFFYPEVLYHASSNEGCSFTFIHFDTILGANYQALHFYPFDGKLTASKVSGFFDALLSCASSLQNNKSFAELEIRGAVMYFLAHLMREKYEKKTDSLSHSHKSALARLQPVLIYINHHLASPIRISELAASINLSEKYFITFFKNTMGITPVNYIIEVKMKKALEYLHEQKYSVKEVASLVGYADIYSFSKGFKKIYGIPPSKF